MSKDRPNRYERHLNKRAKEKKERAKVRHIRSQEQNQQADLNWQAFEQTEATAQLLLGIIVEIRGRIFTVMSHDEYFHCKLSQEIPFELGRRLVIGDKVFFETQGNEGIIKGRVPRTSTLSRLRGDSQRISAAAQEKHVIAANVDTGVIVAAATDPEFHPRFVDRYLTICQNGGIEPVVCVNKCDLTDERHPILEWYKGIGIPVIETSAQTDQGVPELKERIRGKISVLVGNSGVGKSSLINSLIPDLHLAARTVSGKTGKGRHTTTSTNLYKWDDESYIIDTPGIRSLGVSHIEKSNLRFGFPEFDEFADSCKFRDCLHQHEPECAVKQAVAEQKINRYRYESYLRMLEE